MKWQYFLIPLLILVVIIIRVNIRGYFWKARDGSKLTIKQFFSRWKKGALESTPLQQTTIMLWSFLPMIAGIIWGFVITIIAETYWMSLILAGSFPITMIQVVSTYQKYKRLKVIDKTMKELNKNKKNVRTK